MSCRTTPSVVLMPTSSKRSSSAEIQLVNQNVLSHLFVVIILQACPLHCVGTMPVCLSWNDKKEPLHLRHSILLMNTLIVKCCHHFGGHSWFTTGFLSYKHLLDALHFLGPLLDTFIMGCICVKDLPHPCDVHRVHSFHRKGLILTIQWGNNWDPYYLITPCFITFSLNNLKIFHTSYSLTVTLQTCLHLANYYVRTFLKIYSLHKFSSL